MKSIIVEDYRGMSKKAAEVLADLIRVRPAAVIGLATGSTPEGMYARLVEMGRRGELDFSALVTFNLDEYAGLPPGHPQGYHHYMHSKLFDPAGFNPRKVNLPGCHGREPAEVCREYDQKIIAAGGIDLQVLGIGVNGHIGFNEPGSELVANTHLAELAQETVEANSRFFSSPQEVPRQAVTMGVGLIMQAEQIMLLASGKNKAEAVAKSFSGRVTTAVPASLLQLHRNLVLILDRDAAQGLDACRWLENRPGCSGQVGGTMSEQVFQG